MRASLKALNNLQGVNNMNSIQDLDPYALVQFADIIDEILEVEGNKETVLSELKAEIDAEVIEFEKHLEEERIRHYNEKLWQIGYSF